MDVNRPPLQKPDTYDCLTLNHLDEQIRVLLYSEKLCLLIMPLVTLTLLSVLSYLRLVLAPLIGCCVDQHCITMLSFYTTGVPISWGYVAICVLTIAFGTMYLPTKKINIGNGTMLFGFPSRRFCSVCVLIWIW